MAFLETSSKHQSRVLSRFYQSILSIFKMINVRNLAIFFGALLPAVLAAPAPMTKKDDIIPGKFIVTLKPGVDAAAAESHLSWVSDVHKRSLKRNTAGIEKKYKIKDWKAYAGEFDEATIAEIKASPDVSIGDL